MKQKTPFYNYAYACTRVRARKTKMLSSEDFMRLAAMDLDSVARFMGESQYRREIAELAGEFRGMDLIEGATDMNLAYTYAHIMDFFRGRDRAMLGHYLNELDLLNLKTIIRGKFRNVPNDGIMHDLIPGGDFTGKYMNRWVGADDIPELVRALEGTRFYRDLNKALEAEPFIKSTARMEDTLDKAHYAHVLESLKDQSVNTRLFRDFIRREIDTRNVITLLRIKFAFETEKVELSPGDIFIPGGKELDIETLKSLYAVSSPGQLLVSLEQYSFADIITRFSADALERGSPKNIIGQLESHHRRSTGIFATRNPLSILPVIHFLMLKKNEAFNLRLIARGKEMGLSPEKLRELIIL